MKLKGIGWFERNVDKLVLGTVGVVLVGAGALQIVHQPNRVKVGAKDGIAPQDALKVVEEAARNLQSRIDSPNPPEVKGPEFALKDRLAAGMAKGGSPREVIAALGVAPGIGRVEAGVGPVAEAEFAAPAIPAPTQVEAASFRGTIHPVERVRHADLAKLLPPEQPFDKAAVSIGASISGTAIREALAADPDGDDGPLARLREDWYRDPMQADRWNVAILAVQVERELLARADGSTEGVGAKAVVPAMPGRPSTLSTWEQNVKSLGDVSMVLEMVRPREDETLRPRFYALIAGEPWVEPGELRQRQASGGSQQTIEKLQSDLRARRDELTQLQAELDRIPRDTQPGATGTQPPPPPPPRPGGGGGKGGGKGGGVGGGGGGGGGGRIGGGGQAGGEREPTPGDLRIQLTTKISRAKADIRRFERRLTDLGVKLDAAPEPAPGATEARVALFDDPDAKVWAHDLTAEPGATYRYRVRLVMNNPLFGQRLLDKQKDLAERSTVEGEWSAWSEPVYVHRGTEFFLTSANPRDVASPTPRATAELFRYYYGAWRRESLTVAPGDPIEAMASVPTLKIYDLSKIKVDAALPSGEAQPPPDRPPPGGGGGKRGGLGSSGGGGGSFLPGGGSPGAGQEQGPAPDEALKDVPSAPGPKEIALKANAVFLDTRAVVGAAERSLGLLRDAVGTIVVRDPSQDRADERYRWLLAAAESASKKPDKPKTDQPLPPQPDARPPGGRIPGGGGGAGT